MLTKTIIISEDLNMRIKAAVKILPVKEALIKAAGYKNAGEGELIRQALEVGLPTVINKLCSRSQKLVQE